MVSVPEGVTKYSLIDGQQRITTVYLILSVIRILSKESNNNEVADEIWETLLINKFKKDFDRFKLLPTQRDRDYFINLVDNNVIDESSQICKAYKFFYTSIKSKNYDLTKLKDILTKNLSLVSIVLDANENPHVVFESLNYKGEKLDPADLIRNYILMRVHVNRQEQVYSDSWKPIEDRIGLSHISEFIRHYLIMNGKHIKKDEVYSELTRLVTQHNVDDSIEGISFYSKVYEKILYPERIDDLELSNQLTRLNIIEVTTAYPCIMKAYGQFENSLITRDTLLNFLKVLENYLIRRYICNEPTYTLNKIFVGLVKEIEEEGLILQKTVNYLGQKNYPSDNNFQTSLLTREIYAPNEKVKKCKLMLETFERHYSNKETISFDNLSIEHIMPQTLNDDWRKSLGDEAEEVHELHLHKLGNLTLTAYNPEMQNKSFSEKSKFYNTSNVFLSRDVAGLSKWGKSEIESRSKELADLAINLWPYFADRNSNQSSELIPFKRIKSIKIMGEIISVTSWSSGFIRLLDILLSLDEEKFFTVRAELKSYIGKTTRRFEKLSDGTPVNVDTGAENLYSACLKAIELMELSREDFEFSY